MKIKEAIEKLSPEAKEEFKKCTSVEDILGLFSKNGLEVTKKDIEDAIKSKNCELSDDELSNVTGGTLITDVFQDLIKMFVKDLFN